MSIDDRNYEIGYGKPPKHSRFKRGQSGNPAGRKAGSRKTAQPPVPAPLYPTNAALMRRAERQVAIVEDGKRHLISTREALFASVIATALKGGTLAQRTLIGLLQAEDERVYRERNEQFTYWRDHIAKARAKLKVAAERGRPAPDILPHPDDVVLDYETLTVKIIGPVDFESAAQFEKIRRTARLYFELSLYRSEDNHFDPMERGQTRIGFWLLGHINLMAQLPPRMRLPTEAENEGLMLRIGLSRRRWETYVRAECEAVDLPFIPYRRSWPTCMIGELLSDEQMSAFL